MDKELKSIDAHFPRVGSVHWGRERMSTAAFGLVILPDSVCLCIVSEIEISKVLDSTKFNLLSIYDCKVK